jgi:hypothetical protein
MLTEELCRRIETGEIAADDPALIEHLWATTMATLAVDQPNYGTYRRIMASERGDHDSPLSAHPGGSRDPGRTG